MPVAGGGFEQCYNAQAAVAAGSLLVVATDVVQAPNDKRQVEPTLEKIAALPEELGEVENLLADTGYFSADNVEACDKAGVTPVIAMGRQPHYPPLTRLHQLAGFGEAKPLESLGRESKGRHYTGSEGSGGPVEGRGRDFWRGLGGEVELQALQQ